MFASLHHTLNQPALGSEGDGEHRTPEQLEAIKSFSEEAERVYKINS